MCMYINVCACVCLHFNLIVGMKEHRKMLLIVVNVDLSLFLFLQMRKLSYREFK